MDTHGGLAKFEHLLGCEMVHVVGGTMVSPRLLQPFCEAQAMIFSSRSPIITRLTLDPVRGRNDGATLFEHQQVPPYRSRIGQLGYAARFRTRCSISYTLQRPARAVIVPRPCKALEQRSSTERANHVRCGTKGVRTAAEKCARGGEGA